MMTSTPTCLHLCTCIFSGFQATVAEGNPCQCASSSMHWVFQRRRGPRRVKQTTVIGQKPVEWKKNHANRLVYFGGHRYLSTVRTSDARCSEGQWDPSSTSLRVVRLRQASFCIFHWIIFLRCRTVSCPCCGTSVHWQNYSRNPPRFSACQIKDGITNIPGVSFNFHEILIDACLAQLFGHSKFTNLSPHNVNTGVA